MSPFQVPAPFFHQLAASFQQVCSGVGFFYGIADFVSESLFCDLPANAGFSAPVSE